MYSQLSPAARAGEVRAAYADINREVAEVLDPAIEGYLSQGLPAALLNGARLLYKGSCGKGDEDLTQTTATITEESDRFFQLSHERLGEGQNARKRPSSVNLRCPDFVSMNLSSRDGTILGLYEGRIEEAKKILEILKSPETRFDGLFLPATR